VSEENSNGLLGFETVGQFLEEDNWYPQRVENRYAYRVGFSGGNGQLTCFAQVHVEIEQFVFYVYSPIKVPEDARPQVAEFLTRANYGMRIGNFEMDYGDGEVRYKSSLDFEGAVLNVELVRNAIYPAVRMMDDYLPGLLGVVYGDKPPADAIAEIEG
jgi:hypothetical protein